MPLKPEASQKNAGKIYTGLLLCVTLLFLPACYNDIFKYSIHQINGDYSDRYFNTENSARLTRAPGNDAAIGGLKVTTENGWFAARPSGTEDIYKLYAESFKSAAHLQQLVAEAQEIVTAALAVKHE